MSEDPLRYTHEEAVARMTRKERKIRALALFRAGWTHREIASDVGVTNSTIALDIKEALDELNRLSLIEAGRYRRMQLDRLNVALKAIWPRIGTGNLNAIRTMLALMEREARLLGLDAPQKVDIEHRIRAIAEAAGFDPEQAILEAERLLEEVK